MDGVRTQSAARDSKEQKDDHDFQPGSPPVFRQAHRGLVGHELQALAVADKSER